MSSISCSVLLANLQVTDGMGKLKTRQAQTGEDTEDICPIIYGN